MFNRTTYPPGSDRLWSDQHRIPRENLAAFPLLRHFTGLPSHAHCYCMAHGLVNLMKDMMNFMMDTGNKQFTSGMRLQDESKFPDLVPTRGGLLPPVPWLPNLQRLNQWEYMMEHALVPSDVADGQLKSFRPTKNGETKPKIRKGCKFVHILMYCGPLGKMMYEYAWAPSPQRKLMMDILDLLQKGLAHSFTDEELQHMITRGRSLERKVVRFLPIHICFQFVYT